MGVCVDKTGTRLMNAIQCVGIGFVLKTNDGVFFYLCVAASDFVKKPI